MINISEALGSTMTAAVELLNVTKNYGLVPALRDITLEADEGEAVAFLGPNGAGKSTLLKIVAGQIAPSSGHVRVLGLDAARELEAVKRNVGLVGHGSFLYDELTVDENLRFYGSFFDASTEDIERVIETTALESWRASKTRHLSYGLRKQVDIARALLGRPRVLVLDEFFSGLDPEACEHLIEHLKASPGQSILISSHTLKWAGKLCSRGVFLKNGVIVKDVDI